MNDPICRLCRRKLVSSSVPCSLVWYSFVKLGQGLLEIADTMSCQSREGKCFWPYTCHGQEIVDGGVHRSIVCPQHRLYHLCVHVRKHHTEVCHGLIEKKQRNLIITVSVVVGTMWGHEPARSQVGWRHFLLTQADLLGRASVQMTSWTPLWRLQWSGEW